MAIPNQTLQDNLSVPSSTVKNPLKMGPIGCPATSIRNYRYSLLNSPEKFSSHAFTSLPVCMDFCTVLPGRSGNVCCELQVQVKRILVQALRLCTGRTAHRGSRGIALLFHYHGTRRGWRVSVMPRPFLAPGKDPVPILQEAGWAPGPVWTGVENLAPPGFDPWTVQPVASHYTDYASRPTRTAGRRRYFCCADVSENGQQTPVNP